MLPLAEALSQEYMKANPGISVYVYGGGTGGGIKALSRGEVDIAMSSRKISPEEIKSIADKFYSIAVNYLIAKDALCIYANKSNKIKDLSFNQVKDIFSGKITNWKEVGGDDAAIIPIIRNPNSGTYTYFKQHVLVDREYSSNCLVRSSFDDLQKEISSSKYSIGIGGIGGSQNLNHLKIDGIEAIEENVINDRYPISRYLYFYTAKSAAGYIKDFIDWTLSAEGQKVIKKSGYIPIWTIRF
jgi:phosphate transport system substrate-binding protein